MSNNIFNLKGCFTRAQWWQMNLLLGYLFLEWESLSINMFELIYPPIKTEEVNGWFRYENEKFYNSFVDLFDVFNVGSASLIIIISVFLLLGAGLLWVNITSSVKRLHDTNRSGKYWFISLIPILGSIVVLVLNVFFKSEENIYCEKREKNNYWVFIIIALMLNAELFRNLIIHQELFLRSHMYLEPSELLTSMWHTLSSVILIGSLLSFGLFLDKFVKEKLILIIVLALVKVYFFAQVLSYIFNNPDFLEDLGFVLTTVTLIAAYSLIFYFCIKYLMKLIKDTKIDA